jgi:hypothetical protein
MNHNRRIVRQSITLVGSTIYFIFTSYRTTTFSYSFKCECRPKENINNEWKSADKSTSMQPGNVTLMADITEAHKFVSFPKSNPIRVFRTSFYKININITVLSTSTSPKWSHMRFCNKNCVYISCFLVDATCLAIVFLQHLITPARLVCMIYLTYKLWLFWCIFIWCFKWM